MISNGRPLTLTFTASILLIQIRTKYLILVDVIQIEEFTTIMKRSKNGRQKMTFFKTNLFLFLLMNSTLSFSFSLHWYLGVIWNPGSLLKEKIALPMSQSQEFETMPVKTNTRRSIDSKHEVINLGDQEHEHEYESYGKLEGGGACSANEAITISDSDDPITESVSKTQSKSNSEPNSESEYDPKNGNCSPVESLTDQDTPQEVIELQSSPIARRPRSASPDLGAKSTYKKKTIPITGTMKKKEKEKREERAKKTQEDRLNRRKEK
jgi:hypothetical protein